MRISTLFAVTLLCALGLSLAAQADPTVDVLIGGAPSVSVQPNETVTADFYISLPPGESLNGYQLSIGWDPSELSYIESSLINSPPLPWEPPIVPFVPLPGVGKLEGALSAVSSTPVAGYTTFYIGSLSFVATPTDVGGPIDIWAYDTGAFGTDGLFFDTLIYAYVTFNGAKVDLIPEPAAASLLALGLAALAAARRRRRLND